MATIVGSPAGGNWNSGGSWVGGVIPTATSDVQLNATSGNITVNVASTCRSLDCTSYTGTVTQTSVLTIGDSTAGLLNQALKLVAGMTYTSGAGITFVSTNATQQTIDFGGKSLAGVVTFQGIGSSYLLSSAISSSLGINHTAGTLNTNGQSVSCTTFQTTGATTRTLALGASAIAVSSTTPWIASGSNCTITGTSTITASNAAAVFAGGGFTYNDLVFSGAVTTPSITGANTFHSITATGSAIKTNIFTFAASQTITGTLTLNGTSTLNRLLVQSSLIGTPITLTCAAVSFSYADLQDIAGAGAANWNLSAITGLSGDCGGNSGITFTTSATQTSTGTASFAWSTHSWTIRVPLPQDDVAIPNAFSASRVVSLDMPRLGKNITFTCTGTPSITSNANGVIYGNWTFSTTVTTAGAFSLGLAGRGSQTFTSNGVTIAYGITCQSAGGTYTLQDNVTSSGTGWSCQSGTLNVNGKIVTGSGNFSLATSVGLSAILRLSGGTLGINSMVTTAATTRSIDFGANGSINIAGTGAVWNASGAGFTTAGTGTIAITTASAAVRTFAGGGFTYPKLKYSVAGSTGQLTILGSNTFSDLEFKDASNARSLLFTAATTTTVAGVFDVQGTAGKLMTIDSPTAAAHNLSKPSGTVSCDYLSVKNSHAAGGASWYAGANSTDAGGNTGWIFTAPPSSGAASSLLMMGI